MDSPRSPSPEETPATELPIGTAMTVEQELDLVTWHLDRYDRLRASTTSRASVTLSAAAILSAGNAIVLSQLFSELRSAVPPLVLAGFSVLGAASAALVVLALLRATSVLVTLKPSREWLPGANVVPSGSPFNGHDVITEHRTFESFRTGAFQQPLEAIIQAAQADLWICIQQHRHRYTQLRAAVRLLRIAALAFMIVLLVLIFVNLLFLYRMHRVRQLRGLAEQPSERVGTRSACTPLPPAPFRSHQDKCQPETTLDTR